ncbi:MAG: type II toxin-antitoxin system HigA family antitoxin, partial [bacterium]
KPIKTEADYHATLQEIEELFDAELSTQEGDRLEVLTTLVEAYEERNYPIPPPDQIEAIKYYMESRGLSQHDLERLLGSRKKVQDCVMEDGD